MKRLIIALCILSMFTSVFGQIADDEIKINDKGVFFEDFKGEYTYTEPQSEIIRIGILLSQGLKENKKSFPSIKMRRLIQLKMYGQFCPHS